MNVKKCGINAVRGTSARQRSFVLELTLEHVVGSNCQGCPKITSDVARDGEKRRRPARRILFLFSPVYLLFLVNWKGCGKFCIIRGILEEEMEASARCGREILESPVLF